MNNRPVVLQHVFGEVGGGGPIGALQRLLNSQLIEAFDMPVVRQVRPAGGISLPLIRQMSTQMRALRPDLVHVRGLGNEGFHGVVAARLAGCKRILVSVHGTHRDLTDAGSLRRRARREFVVGALEPATLRLATGVSTVCDFAASRSFLLPYSDKMVGVVPNGVASPALSPMDRRAIRMELKIPASDIVLTYAGRLSTEKGLHFLAEALSMLPDEALSKTTTIIVGDGPERLRLLSQLAADQRIRFRFLGTRLDVAHLLHASDIFVFPTLHENLSNALIEAMAAGTAVVATNVGGNSEVLSHGSGILVPPKTPLALAVPLLRLITHPREVEAYAEAARLRHMERYTVEKMALGWGSVYTKMLES